MPPRSNRAILIDMKRESSNLKVELILAGIREIEAHSVRGFSLRRVAKNCNVSCAALMFDNGELPYTEENRQHVRYLIDREFDLP